MRVVLVVLDAFPNRLVSAETTPTLWRLTTEGGHSIPGGISELTAATYPNHATFVTGVPTIDHGIVTNRVLAEGEWVNSSRIGPAAPTLFEACRSEGRSSVAVVGDQELVGVCGLRDADAHWPPNGEVPEGVRRGIAGYIADDEVVAAADRLAVGDHDFVFAQIDEVDGVRHTFGAWSDEAMERVRATDAALGRFVELLGPRWDDTVMLVVGDHDQEDLSPDDPIDLRDRFGPGVEVEAQGTAAQVVGEVDLADLLDVPGVVGAVALDPTHHVVWGGPGQAFGSEAPTIAADHGSPRTRTQLAVVGGGHPTVPSVADRIAPGRPAAASWAALAAELLDLRWRPSS